MEEDEGGAGRGGEDPRFVADVSASRNLSSTIASVPAIADVDNVLAIAR